MMYLLRIIQYILRLLKSRHFTEAENPNAEEMFSTTPVIGTWRESFTKDWKKIQAFLDMISYAEGTDKFGNDKGYNVIVGGELFTDYSDHPRKMVHLPRYKINSTAAGRYQILARFWDHYKAQLRLPDFGHDSQDRYAIQQLREQRALDPLLNGDVKTAIERTANIWASFPGAGYGQREVQMDKLVSFYWSSLRSL